MCLSIIVSDYLGSILYELVKAIPEEKALNLRPHLQLLFDKLAEQVGNSSMSHLFVCRAPSVMIMNFMVGTGVYVYILNVIFTFCTLTLYNMEYCQ